MSHDDKTILTLREIADIAGISVDAARRRAKRRDRDKVWRILPSNHPQDPLRIELPRSDLDALGRPDPARTERQEVDESVAYTSVRPETDDTARQGVDVEAIAEIVATFTDRVDSLTERLLAAERERAVAHSEAEIAKAEVSRLHERIEAAMVSHRSELERRDAEADRINASREAEIEALKGTLAEMRARPWWSRLAG